MTDGIQTAYIQGAFAIGAAVITSAIVTYFSRKWFKQERLVSKLTTAKSDIEYLLVLESLLLSRIQELEGGLSPKKKYRSLATKSGVTWSGKNTLSRVRG